MLYRKVFVAETASDLNVTLPEEYLHKGVEVIAFEVNEVMKSSHQAKKEAAHRAVEFFKTIQIDLSGFKFNRDEANER